MTGRSIIFYVIAAVYAFCVGFLPPKVYGLAESTGPAGCNAQAVHNLGQTGQGISLALISAGNARVSHEAFEDANSQPHAFAYNFTDESTTWTTNHETWMAGIVASRGGLTHPNDIGVAPGVDVHSAKVTAGETGPDDPNRVIDFSWLVDALESLITDHNCAVIVTGFGLKPADADPNGQSDWTLLYDYYAYERDVVFANAAGNTSTRIPVFGDAYNGITTGGLILDDPSDEYVYRRVGSKSGSGFTDDGRRKPELAGPSQNQTMPNGNGDTSWYTWTSDGGETSFSAPHTAGAAALLVGLADSTLEPDDEHNEVIKAVMVNSAFGNIDDREGDSTEPAEPNNVWHRERGYGRIDALGAYETLVAGRIQAGSATTQVEGWAFDTLSPQSDHIYTISVQEHDRLVATLAWNRRIEWFDEEQGSPPMINEKIDPGELHEYLANLDLVVYEPNNPSAAIFSEALCNLNPQDNLEKCDILLAVSGDCTIKVVNVSANGETAEYGFAFELLPPITGDFDLNYVVDNYDFALFAGEWQQQGEGLEADLWPDLWVEEKDLFTFVGNWLITDDRYYVGQ